MKNKKLKYHRNNRLLILFFDIVIAASIGFWASNTYPKITSIFIILFFIALILRVWIDFFTETIEEKFFKKHIQAKYFDFENNLELQSIIADKMKESLKNGDIKGYNEYSVLKKSINNG